MSMNFGIVVKADEHKKVRLLEINVDVRIFFPVAADLYG
jgi:hypothetical protein